MSKKKSNHGSAYSLKHGYENSFIYDVINTYNEIPQIEIEAQKNALRNIIEHIRRAHEEGLTVDEIEEKVLYNMNNLFTIIKYPNLVNFYQLRTLEYMMDLDIEPYIEEMLKDGFDISKYREIYKNKYSANLENNVIIELYGMIEDLLEATNYTTDTQYHVLCEKARNGKLTIDDKELLTKYINLYLKELQIGKSVYWEAQRKDPETCRKLLLKYRDKIFRVNTFDNGIQMTDMNPADRSLVKSIGEQKSLDEIKASAVNLMQDAERNPISIAESVTSLGKSNKGIPFTQVSLKGFSSKPFISNDKEANFLIIMSEALHKFQDMHLYQLYEMLMASEYGKSPLARERGKQIIYDFFQRISFQKNLMHAREHLQERLAVLITFYKASGCLGEYCDINNNKLSRIYLGDLQIDEDTLFSKFINDPNNADYYFVDDYMDYERACRGTPIFQASDEAIIGMSAFYTNRMTKEAQTYSMLAYILDKKNVIESICDNPDLKFEDFEFTDDEICTYMAMYKCFQRLMVRNFFQNVDSKETLYEEDVHNKLVSILGKYRNVYERYYPDLGFDFDRDIDLIMMDAQMIDEMYHLKGFSVKSLLYTAITDKKKNIINWGIVPEDEQEDEKFALLGFDIKSLNTPLFVHMKREDLKQFIEELTGGTKIRVYEGANDMYSYSIKQRVTAQVLYPLSKDEKRRLAKVQGTGALTDYYKHIRWLQQPKTLPQLLHEPGSREYDLETNKIVKGKTDAPIGRNTSGKKSKKTGEDR